MLKTTEAVLENTGYVQALLYDVVLLIETYPK